MKKNRDEQSKPLEINPTTLVQLDPDKLDGVVGGLAAESTKTGDTCDGCTHVGPDCKDDHSPEPPGGAGI